ncbi:helix-turn-helix domain-containing protein [Sinorhizobium fredii]|uniref:helix-turn-helix domain-containing protein n=1 Tax=Rhizobium fredii TaxID=380 RepID=UPI00351757E5
MTSETHLADSIRQWRSREGVTAAELAALLDIPKRTLDGIEQGRPFRYDRLLRLALVGVEEVGNNGHA